MAVITPQALNINGVIPTYNTASSGGDSFPNDGKTYCHIKNGGGSSINVTFASIASASDNALGDLSLSNLVVAIAAGAEKIFGNFPLARFDDVNGQVDITYSAVSSVTIAVIKEGKSYL